MYICSHSISIPGTKKRLRCGFAVSRDKGSFLESTKLEPWQIAGFINLWRDSSFCYSIASRNLNINKITFLNLKSLCGTISGNWLHHQDPIGGEGITVDIDETLILKKEEIQGHVAPQIWLIGGIERESGKRFIIPPPAPEKDSEPNNPHNREKLIASIIQQFVKPGTIIYSLSLREYGTLERNVKFVDPEDSADKNAHTQRIESGLWKDVRRHTRRPEIKGNLKDIIARYLFLTHHKEQALHHFLLQVAKLYPPLGNNIRPVPPHVSESDSCTDSESDWFIDSDSDSSLDTPRLSKSSE